VKVSRPRDITVGADGALWFTNQGSLWFPKLNKNPIGRITVTGAISSYPVAGLRSAFAIVAGRNNSLWFTRPHESVVAILRPSRSRDTARPNVIHGVSRELPYVLSRW